jgi:hypothetical protein
MVWNDIVICEDQEDTIEDNIYTRTPLSVDNQVLCGKVERNEKCDGELNWAVD